jgi:hypothetical protein
MGYKKILHFQSLYFEKVVKLVDTKGTVPLKVPRKFSFKKFVSFTEIGAKCLDFT